MYRKNAPNNFSKLQSSAMAPKTLCACSDNSPAAPGFGQSGDVMPMLPSENSPAAPDFGQDGDVIPSLPSFDLPATPGFGQDGDVTPTLPGSGTNQPATPGFGPNGNVTPTLPGSGTNPNITVVPVIPNLAKVSFIRFFNALPDVGSVDIYVNGKLLLSSVKYKEFTSYFRATAGLYRIVIYLAGTVVNPLSISRITVAQGNIYTAAISGDTSTVNFELITDNKRPVNNNVAYLRFIHLSFLAPAVDIYVDNVLRIADITYEEVSSYLSVTPGVHNVKIKVAGTTNTVIEVPDLSVSRGNFYSGYVVGNPSTKPGLQFVPTVEGISYITY